MRIMKNPLAALKEELPQTAEFLITALYSAIDIWEEDAKKHPHFHFQISKARAIIAELE